MNKKTTISTLIFLLFLEVHAFPQQAVELPLPVKHSEPQYSMQKVSLIESAEFEVIDILSEWDNLPKKERKHFIDEVRNGNDFKTMENESILILRKMFLKMPTKDNAHNLREAIFEYRRMEMKSGSPEKITLLKSDHSLRNYSTLSNSSGNSSSPLSIINQQSKIINPDDTSGSNAKSNSGGSGKGSSGGGAKANTANFITDRALTNTANTDLNTSMAVDGNGNVYVAYSSYNSFGNPDQIRVDKSTDGGYKWTNSTVIDYAAPLDFPIIRVDGNNYIYVVYEYQYSGSDYDIYMQKSTNGGTSWTQYTVNASGDDTWYPAFCIDNSNNLYVVFNHWDGFWGVAETGCRKSTDGGSTWFDDGDNDYDDVNNNQTSNDYNPYIDAGFNNYIYCVWAYNSGQIVIKNSTDGTAWSSLQVIRNTDFDDPGQHVPTIAASRDAYTAVAAWYDYTAANGWDTWKSYTTSSNTIATFDDNVSILVGTSTYGEGGAHIYWSSDDWNSTTNRFFFAYWKGAKDASGYGDVKFAHATEAAPGTWTSDLQVSDGADALSYIRGQSIVPRKGTANAYKYPAVAWPDEKGSGTPNIYYSTYGRYYTITTNPGGYSVTIDAITNTAPQSFDWPAGVSHTLNTTSPQGGCTWSSWSDAGAQSHSITTDYSSATTTITATFTCSMSGYFTSPDISFSGGAACGSWTEVGWTQTLGGSTVVMELCDGAGVPISGWTNTQAGDGAKTWDISALSSSTYPTIRLRANLSGTTGTAQVNSWYCRFTTQGDATTYVWNGSVSNAWNNASNWCGGGGGFPNSATKDVVVKTSFGTLNSPNGNDATARCRDLTVESGRTLNIANNLQIDGNLWIKGSPNATIEHTGGTITLAGDWRQDGGYNRNNATTTVTFSGTAKQIYGANTPYLANATLANPSSYTINGPGLNVWTAGGAGGALTINLNGSLDANGKPMQVQGNWNNTSGTFTHGSNTVTLNGGDATITTGGTGAGKIFYNVVCDASTKTKTLGGNIDINANFTITNGTWDVSAASDYNMFVAGDWTNNGTFNNGGTDLVVFDDFTDLNYTASPAWTVQAGGFIATGARLEGTDAVVDDRISTPSTQAYGTWEFTYEFEVTTDGNYVRYFIIMSADNADPGNAAADGYYVWVDGWTGANRLRLRRLDNGVTTDLILSDWTPGTAVHTIKVTRSTGNLFELFLDGLSKGTYTDNTYTSSSYMGVWTSGEFVGDNHKIDNIKTNSGSGGTVTFDGTSLQNISGTSVTAFYNATVANNNGVTLNINTMVNKVLTLSSGSFTLNQKTLMINNTSIGGITRTSGYIVSSALDQGFNSKVQWTIGSITGDHIFPFGTAADYLPFTFNLTGGGPIGDVTVSTYSAGDGSTTATTVYANKPTSVANLDGYAGSGDPGNAENIIKRFWSISPTGTGTSTITFTYASSEEPIGLEDANDMGAQRFSTSWNAYLAGQTSNTTANTVVVPGVTAFSPWGISKKSKPLPITILSFTGKCTNNIVTLKWQTASEINNDFFTIERSIDAIDFSQPATMDGAGNSNTLLNYEYLDLSPYSTINYYRLKQTDFDGKFSYSDIIAVTCRYAEEDEINAYSNSRKEIIITLLLKNEPNSFIALLFDAAGKMVLASTLNPLPGANLFKINAENLSPGIYYIVIQNENEMVTRKIPLL